VAAVEFAIVSTMLFLLVFGIIQFGLALTKIETFENAARQGGREAAVSASVTTYTVNQIKMDVADASQYDITGPITIGLTKNGLAQPDPQPAERPCAPGGTGPVSTDNWQVKVSWTQEIPISIPFMPAFTINHGMSATFRCEPAS
jgi:Flp pilus assembly protein TadG